ncbi:TPA: hypothetical protein J5G26_002149 [Escherichia coli]|nr:hypothetical protein [Escherichia coli]HBA4001493.1 hypothetical protein [Escherichia coli]HBA4018546.1 hypothetical protein [Escherichia coli]HBA4023026.1 hypothetical protein [Escherichia coli]HBA4027843.1 hypothetical protein [Escherichia coli]
MEKKNRPLQAANSDIRVSDITPLTKSLQAPKRTPKKHRARVYMLRTGIEGWTENDILRYCRLSSGRNYATELERQLGITLERIDEKNPDGTGNPSEVAVYSNGIVAMPLYPVAERLAMANNIEGAMIERFGIESGTERAIIFYRAMMDVEQGALTPFGRETLAELHNSFIAELNENGMPAEPVTH